MQQSNGKLVLVVDDTPTTAAAISEVLKDSYRIKIATNGEKALALATAVEKPDLILLDVNMPGMDGFETCRRLKADPSTGAIPVIFLTAMTDAVDETKGFEVGAVDYIHKPISAPIVLARVKTQIALREALLETIEQEKHAALGRLVTGIAHEINTPVGMALTVSSALRRRSEDLKDQLAADGVERSRLKEFLAQVVDGTSQLERNLERAKGLISTFTQVSADRASYQRRVVNLRDVVTAVVGRTALDIAVDVPADLELNTYPDALDEVLSHLALNAFRHAFSGGNVGNVSIESRRTAPDRVEISVIDDGIGMPESVRAHIFDPFFTTRRGDGGVGLGLHIVYNLVSRLLNGTIDCETQPGSGTRFRVSLPTTTFRSIASGPAPAQTSVEHGWDTGAVRDRTGVALGRK
jgi:signal transduction histidine kinase